MQICLNYVVIRTQQGRQRKSSVKTLSLPFCAEFWRHCVLRSGTQRSDLPRDQGEENGNIKYFNSSSGNQTNNLSRLQSHFVPLRQDWLI